MTEKLTRWRKEAVKEIRSIHPDQLLPILRSKRFSNGACLNAFLERIEAAITRDALEARALASAAPSYAKRVDAKDFDIQARAWALQGSTNRVSGDLQSAEECFKVALDVLPADSLEGPAVWIQLAALRSDQGRVPEGLSLTERSITLLHESEDPRVNSCDRFALATMYIYEALLKWRDGCSCKEIAEPLLIAIQASTESTPLSRDLAAQSLAIISVIGWMRGGSGFHPDGALKAIRRMQKKLQKEGHGVYSLCRSRLFWFEGLALAYIAQSLTRAAESKLGMAEKSLIKSGSNQDLVMLLLDRCYWLIREERWASAAANAQKAHDIAATSGFNEEAIVSLRQWQETLRGGSIATELTARIYESIRGVSSVDLSSSPRTIVKRHRWKSTSGW